MTRTFRNFDMLYKDAHNMVKKSVFKFQNTYENKKTKVMAAIAKESIIHLDVNNKLDFEIVCTLKDIEGLIVGFLMTSYIIDEFNQLMDAEYLENNRISIQVDRTNEDLEKMKKDTMKYLTSGSISQMESENFRDKSANRKKTGKNNSKEEKTQMKPSIKEDISITSDVIFQAQDKLRNLGTIWRETGGTHMSAVCDTKGNILFYSEDVGRHNT
ncbi:MAG: hypothetical protein GF364_13385, partial [Candidatus Lokiarchaeota archaeon]|nr:hypothetical protein [Candidatus Lokiarchaeota archaeon]